MRDGETTASARRIPLDLDDGAGAEYTGTAPTGSEVLLSIQGGPWATAAGTVTKLRDGDFYYESTEAESRGRGMRVLRVAKSGMGTACFDWYCGDRCAADPSDEARRIPVMLELAGVPVTGITLTGAEVEISVVGAAFATGTGSVAAIGFGVYYYQPSIAEYVRGQSTLSVLDAAADEYKYELTIGAEINPAPTGTTAADVRDRMAAVIAAIIPQSNRGDRFRESRYESADDFITDCETQPAGAFRRFSVVYTGNEEPVETSSVYDEERRVTYTVTVAYPKNARAGNQQGASRNRLIEEDLRSIDRAIGPTGKANFSDPYPDATWVGGGDDRDSGEACDFLVYTVQMLILTTWSAP